MIRWELTRENRTSYPKVTYRSVIQLKRLPLFYMISQMRWERLTEEILV